MTWHAPDYSRWGDTPIGYTPEQWDVVRDDGLVLIVRTSILDADNQVAFLNARMNGRHSYETRPSEDAGADPGSLIVSGS